MKVPTLVLLLLGVIVSAHLFYTNYLLHTLPYCPANACFPPAEMILPSYFFAFLGLLWFLTGMVLVFKTNSFLKIWQISGIVGVLFLFSYSILIHYYCHYCYLAHALAIASVLTSWKSLK